MQQNERVILCSAPTHWPSRNCLAQNCQRNGGKTNPALPAKAKRTQAEKKKLPKMLCHKSGKFRVFI